MVHPTRLMRSAFCALAVAAAAPIFGVQGGLFGVTQAYAQNEGRTVAAVVFEGNQRFNDGQLVRLINVAPNTAFNDALIQRDIESIRHAYDSASFRNVKVTARSEGLEDGRVRVIFKVEEGLRSGIAGINFTGNNAFNSNTLKGVIVTKETGFLSWLLRDDIYDEQRLAADKEAIRVFYANRGYPDAVVTSAVAEYDATKNSYYVNYTISEGEKYDFGAIGIETSIAGLDPNALKGQIRTNQGGRYSLRDLQNSLEDIAYEATAQGYSFADVRPRLDRDIANHRFNITYLVDEGPRVYVERINITGNEKTRDFVIRRELDFAEGDPFNRSMIQRGKTEIEGLDFFQAVNITTEQGSAPDKVVINIAVSEKSTGEYGVTAGYSTSEGILGELSLTERNFLGRGQYLRAAVGASETGKSFDFSFTEPRFMGLKISAGFDVYHRIIDETSTSYYGTTATGGQIRFGVPITRDLSATVFTGLEHRQFKDEDDTYTSQIVSNGQEANKAWIGYTLAYNTLDNTKKPTEGLYATFTQSYNAWDYNYLKTEARARYFVPFSDTGIVGSIRGIAGVINSLDDTDVSPTESYVISSSIIRGFETRGVGPRLASGEYLGTTWYAGLSAEVQFPIPVLPETYGLSGAVWADAAYVGDPTGGYTATDGSVDQNLRTSIGASLIWDSPFGPLRGDFAHVINKATDDRTQVFQLTLSTLL